ncbi:arylesterase (plasmid) [Pusillibacter faecalis]|uniref:Arylesterase n=1 Tax=Pusillibacter faecalis TaxID=2714358 RepID=A0A830QR42_9FIRM|nr:GDSL-type esterase/lipase family protein [Pusillibacter faecalis]BCK85887.1 arylesterase [Pusillibacter faecalis]
MKILCFGDSNTYGYDPRSYFGEQYPAKHRWVDLLARKLDCKAVNAGENGREIPRREGELQCFDLMLSNQKPLDFLLVMLCSNDLLQGNSVEAVAQRMEAFLTRIPLENSQIVLIGPPRIRPGAWITDNRLLEDCVRLNTAYQLLTEKLGVRFVDATNWDIEVTFDGVHYSEKGHQTFAKNLYLALK